MHGVEDRDEHVGVLAVTATLQLLLLGNLHALYMFGEFLFIGAVHILPQLYIGVVFVAQRAHLTNSGLGYLAILLKFLRGVHWLTS